MFSKFAAPALAVLALLATAPGVIAQSPEELVEQRQALMKEDGGILRNAGGLSGTEATAAMDKIITNYTLLPTLFTEGSIVGDSKALPIIWEKRADFEAIFAKGVELATAAKVAAAAGDSAAYGAALKDLGGTCGECHSQYRSR